MVLLVPSVQAQSGGERSRLMLRDLTRIETESLEFDSDRVRLADGRTFGIPGGSPLRRRLQVSQSMQLCRGPTCPFVLIRDPTLTI